MLDARFRPLPKWTRTPGLEGRQAQFKMPYNKTLDLLEFEILKLEGRSIVIEAGFTLGDIRNDGWPRGGAKASHAGVVLYFESKNGALCFPCGTYGRMEDNIHAIALTLEKLRAIDRYGVTLNHQQYIGFAGLPAPSAFGTVDQAAELFASLAGRGKQEILQEREAYRRAYRVVASRLHPDTGGDRGAWEAFQNAAVLLEEHHAMRETAGA